MRSTLFLKFYAAEKGIFLPTFRGNLSGPIFKGQADFSVEIKN